MFKGFGRGKVILLGEHSVVYGHPALVAGLDQGAAVSVGWAHERDTLDVPQWNLSLHRSTIEEHPSLWSAFMALKKSFALDGFVECTFEINLWPRAGLGCSAAMGVALSEAFDKAANTDLSVRERVEKSLIWERVFHGNPSGIDSMAAALGGLFIFEKGQDRPVVSEVQGGANFFCAVADSNEGADTASMVSAVRSQWESDPSRVEKTFEGIASLVRNARLAISYGDLEELGRLMTLNQWLLNALMVSTTSIQRLCDIAKEAGALGAKLTGSGGGGCVIALGRDRQSAESIASAWQSSGHPAFVTEIGC